MTTDATRPLHGKCALITGSTQGLGLAAANALARAGCHVVVTGVEAAEVGDAIRSRIERDYGARAIYVRADLAAAGAVELLMEAAAREFGAVDILVNNAVVRHTAPVEQFPVEQWNEALAVNLSAAFHAIRLALPAMKQRRWGRIVNVSSIYGLRGAPNRAAYVTTKTALIGLTRAVALEVVQDGITCNAVCPGTTESPVHAAAIEQLAARRQLAQADAEREFLRGKQPTGRFILASQVAALIAFLCGPDAADITGATLPVDGGWSAS